MLSALAPCGQQALLAGEAQQAHKGLSAQCESHAQTKHKSLGGISIK